MEVVNALGRRKSAIARVFVSEGTGKITINKRDLAEYFPSSILQYVVKQPLNKLGVAEKYDIKVNLCGGGFTGQSQALRLAIARALVKINPEDKAALRAEGSGQVNKLTRFSLLASQLITPTTEQRLVSKLPGLFLRRLPGGWFRRKTKKKVNELKKQRLCQEQILIHCWKQVATSAI